MQLKHLLLGGILLLSGATASAQSGKSQLAEGDIILQRIPCGNLCQAIIETTPCQENHPYNHCGIVHIKNGQAVVIEAIGKAVKETPIDTFLKREKTGTISIARLKKKYRKAIAPAVVKATAYEGTPYDNVFLPGDNALYCSELVWETYKQPNGQPMFPLQPMTFKSPKTGETYPAWTDYYKDLNQPIPEGQPGINPCAIANAPQVELLQLKR